MMNLNNLESMMSHTIQVVLHSIGFTANEILQMIVCSACLVLTYKFLELLCSEDDEDSIEDSIENMIKFLKTLAIYILLYIILIPIFLFLKFGII